MKKAIDYVEDILGTVAMLALFMVWCAMLWLLLLGMYHLNVWWLQDITNPAYAILGMGGNGSLLICIVVCVYAPIQALASFLNTKKVSNKK